jgi:hypothetical protein
MEKFVFIEKRSNGGYGVICRENKEEFEIGKTKTIWSLDEALAQTREFLKEPDEDITDQIVAKTFDSSYGHRVMPMYKGEGVNRQLRTGVLYVKGGRVYKKN